MAGSTPALYQRVADAFRARITDGTWPPGHRLPSRAELGAEFGGGDNVIRKAQELLISEGLLEGRPGSGTYVLAPQERLHMLRSPAPGHPSASLAPAGISTWDAQSTAKVPAPAAIAARLGITAGDLCVRTEYEFLDTGRRPVMTSTSWEPMAITGQSAVVLPDGGPLGGRSVIDRMAHLGIAVVRTVERPRPVQADRDQAQRLNIPAGSLALLIERTFYDDGDRPVETADLLLPADRWDIDYDIPLASAGPRS
ncbi:GntR family transcriptional regulator [Streptomyces katrae]|uniref:GntR family transcriptional regulator n=1 Tax=Streptomyces katrae TaxID=68223 RepID=UPI0004C09146|nr:GntR family transcriptional regulator [Streptomyces katrae]